MRNLERELSNIARKAIKGLLMHQNRERINVDGGNLEEYLGVRKFRFGEAEEEDHIGVTTGLAWTEVGGDILLSKRWTCRARGSSNKPASWAT